jgi:hypothetical protein
VLSFAFLFTALAVPAHAAEVHIHVNIGPPPIYYVHPAPRLVYLPQPAVYVAVGIPYDIYYVGGRYYHLRGDNWYWSPRHGGPWNHVVYRSLPPGLQKYKFTRLREFRDREYYEVKGKSKGKGSWKR